MAVPRGSSKTGVAVRGSLVKGESSAPPSRSRATAQTLEDVSDPTRPRDVIDYALQRRADVRRFHRGGMLTSDFCDADPYLIKAAIHHGEATSESCPACHTKKLVVLRYVYGDELGPLSGRIRAESQLASLAVRVGRVKVYVVEVCTGCHWNYLLRTFCIGDGVPRPLGVVGPAAS